MPDRFAGGKTNDYLEFFCRSTAIPEVRTEQIAVRGHSDMGIIRAQPSLIIWGGPLQIEVIENRDFTNHRAFKKWFDRIAINADQQGGRTMRINYYKQYTGDIQLVKLEQQDRAGMTLSGMPGAGITRGEGYKEVLRVKFINAYPKAVGSVKLDQSAYNQFTSFNVEFQYESYTTDYLS